jgi:hypothetical protein
MAELHFSSISSFIKANLLMQVEEGASKNDPSKNR